MVSSMVRASLGRSTVITRYGEGCRYTADGRSTPPEHRVAVETDRIALRCHPRQDAPLTDLARKTNSSPRASSMFCQIDHPV
ncbi:MAG: hypothetical protein AVDCRST_MAG93-9780 [uncultured Chloroflexia bacterium]|uniref:Uncharacterized protein n=1 Tax=uncultured Chloroflexia bacterium TaxID=1672391 RepID=A0A6J4NTM0_9CHLR|nr:MAG: hypothetical protein AVDCRST_MAG93-9780 [uncultured Chloroflexia bacterium]